MRTDVRFDTGTLVVHESTAAQRRRAALVVAGHARDAADLAELLAMLGLAATDVRPADELEPGPVRPQPALPPRYMAELAELAARSHAATTPSTQDETEGGGT